MLQQSATPEAELHQRNLVEVIPLGAGQEVGRSCIILKYMCDPAANKIKEVKNSSSIVHCAMASDIHDHALPLCWGHAGERQ